MATRDFLLPDLGEGLEDAELVRWLVEEGQEVTLNQPLVEVDTAKALVEIPSPFAGVIAKLHAAPGEVVRVGAPLVTFELEGQDGEEQPKRKAVLVGYGVEESTSVKRRRRLSGARNADDTSAKVEAQATGRAMAAPPVRKLAQELGIDLAAISGTGPSGRITREDVLAAGGGAKSSAPAMSGGADERIAVQGVRRVVAEKMTRSVTEIPHVTTYLSVDASEVLAFRSELKSEGIEVTPLAIISKAFIATCIEHRKLNASWDSQTKEIILKGSVHLGIATDSERGLVVPVVSNADQKTIQQLGKEIARLAADVRAGKASLEDLTGSTVTISNVGSFGAEYGTPIINHPESSILAVGVIEERPVAKDGGVFVRPMMTLSLSFDHRIMDGAEAGRALNDLKRMLEERAKLRSLG